MTNKDRIERLLTEYRRYGGESAKDATALADLLYSLEIAERDSHRLQWLERRFGPTLKNLLRDHAETGNDYVGQALGNNIDHAAGSWPDSPKN